MNATVENIDVDDLPDPGVTRRPCDDVPVLRFVNAEKCIVAASSKRELDQVLGEVCREGWQVVVRGHDSETGRHEAKLLRPYPYAQAHAHAHAGDQHHSSKSSKRVRRRAGI